MPAESFGALLTRLRLARGHSQLRLAEMLCATSGVPTITRHEISRWERGDRTPSVQWLAWLAFVLHVPPDELERATTRRRPATPTAATSATTTTATAAAPTGTTVATDSAPTSTATFK
jgi:transcriptional regulator with XRE-family HTH domain